MKRVLILLLFVLLSIATAGTKIERYALFIGCNDGGPERDLLRYAVSDARSFAKVLHEIGGLYRENTVMLNEPDSLELELGFQKLARKLNETPTVEIKEKDKTRKEVFLYYSGHADYSGIMLGAKRYPYKMLRDRFEKLNAEVKIAIVDACESGAFIRNKGGVHKQPFLVDESSDMEGIVIITSSSEDEVSQESDKLQGSFFTNSMVTGLRGAADVTGDKRVSLSEAYQYAFNETLSKTSKAQGGAQHPTHEMSLSGTGDVIVTDIKRTNSGVLLSSALSGTLYVWDENGNLVVEMRKNSGREIELGLVPGTYNFELQKTTAFQISNTTVKPNRRIVMTPSDFKTEYKVATINRGDKKALESPEKRGAYVTTDSGTVIDLNNMEECEDDSTSDCYGCKENDKFVSKFGITEVNSPLCGTQLSLILNKSTSNICGSQISAMINKADAPINGAQAAGFINLSSSDINGGQGAGFANIVAGDVLGGHGAGFLNMVGGDVYGGQGAGFLNIAGGTVQGGQGAGFTNIIKGDCKGGQGAGFTNITFGAVYGGQGSGFMNFSGGEVQGGQGAGFLNIAGGNVKGGQGAGFMNLAKGDVYGYQGAGFLNFIRGNSRGGQASGFANFAEGDIKGTQVAGFINITEGTVKGAQIAGFMNVAYTDAKVQIAPINISGNDKTRQIGLINLGRENDAFGYFSIDEMGLKHINFTSGKPNFHFSLGAFGDIHKTIEEHKNFSFKGKHYRLSDIIGTEIGLGTGWQASKSDRIHFNVSVQDVMLFKHNFDRIKGSRFSYISQHMNRANFGMSFRLPRIFGIYAGTSANFLYNIPNGTKAALNVPSAHVKMIGTDSYGYFWPGFSVGIMIGRI